MSPPASGSCMLSAMNDNPTAIERAFQLAKSGRYASVGHIQKALAAEGYSKNQMAGPSLLKQLKGLIRSAQGSRDALRP
jgi:hypothetical protein